MLREQSKQSLQVVYAMSIGTMDVKLTLLSLNVNTDIILS